MAQCSLSLKRQRADIRSLSQGAKPTMAAEEQKSMADKGQSSRWPANLLRTPLGLLCVQVVTGAPSTGQAHRWASLLGEACE